MILRLVGVLLSSLAFAVGEEGTPPPVISELDTPPLSSAVIPPVVAPVLDTLPVRLPGVVIRSTRGERRIEDDPIRVDVISREEVEEKLLMTPGSVAMLLAETAGIRVEEGSPALGGATIRIQGLPGRYTRLLVDGLPLHPGPTGSLGLLQIPPMDLEQVEVVKGVASALYGPAAMGGVVNLISREPDGETELLLNITSAGGRDLLGWWSQGDVEGGVTVLAGVHQQDRRDLSDDGWANLPRYRRAVVRPRAFGTLGGSGRWMATVGATVEDREGGGRGGVGQFEPVGVDTERLDAGATLRFPVGRFVAGLAAAASRADHDHRHPGSDTSDRHSSIYLEGTLGGVSGGRRWLAGAVYEEDRYQGPRSDLNFWFRTPAAFLQAEARLLPTVTGQGSLRADVHSEYGTLWSPRAALRVELPEGFLLRTSVGAGGFAPTALVDAVDEVGIARVHLPDDLEAERALSGSVDLTWHHDETEAAATLFASRIRNPLAHWEEGAPGLGRLMVANLETDLHTTGAEFLVRHHAEPLAFTLFHTWLNVREADPLRPEGGRPPAPMVPRHQTGLVAFLEEHDLGRVGVEVYRTASFPLDHASGADRSRTTWVVGVLGEWVVGQARLFINLENLGNVRQDRYEPALSPTSLPSPAGRQTREAWTSQEGRVINGGVRWSF